MALFLSIYDLAGRLVSSGSFVLIIQAGYIAFKKVLDA